MTQSTVLAQSLHCLPLIKQFSANHKVIYQYFVPSFSFFLFHSFLSLDSALGTLGILGRYALPCLRKNGIGDNSKRGSKKICDKV